MPTETLFTSVKVISYVVLAAMIGAIGYAAYISLTHWSGIGV